MIREWVLVVGPHRTGTSVLAGVLHNLGVNMGILPTKGLTLPFMSYGGSSMVVMCIAIALLLRADFELHRHDRPTQREVHKW